VRHPGGAQHVLASACQDGVALAAVVGVRLSPEQPRGLQSGDHVSHPRGAEHDAGRQGGHSETPFGDVVQREKEIELFDCQAVGPAQGLLKVAEDLPVKHEHGRPRLQVVGVEEVVFRSVVFIPGA